MLSDPRVAGCGAGPDQVPQLQSFEHLTKMPVECTAPAHLLLPQETLPIPGVKPCSDESARQPDLASRGRASLLPAIAGSLHRLEAIGPEKFRESQLLKTQGRKFK